MTEKATKQLFFPDWQPIRAALEHAYKELGLQMEEPEPGLQQYNVDHWNIAGLVRQYVIDQGNGACIKCRTALNYSTVIRCLDCRAQLCEYCAPAHFGPQHGARSAAAHP